MVGEIRDIETARIAVEASLTGHVVLSTLHTNDAPGAVTRLIDMGLEPFLLSASLEFVLAQRLVRKFVLDADEFEPKNDVFKNLGLNPNELIEILFRSWLYGMQSIRVSWTDRSVRDDKGNGCF